MEFGKEINIYLLYYGASVVRHSFSYGHEQGLWELAVIKWNDNKPAIINI